MTDTPDLHPDFERWPPEIAGAPVEEMPGWITVIGRGLKGRCPCCGQAPVFNGYLKVFETCRVCGAPLGKMPADDAPPYFAMVAVLQVVALFVAFCVKTSYHPGVAVYGVVLVAVALACLVSLRMAKGAVIGALLKLGGAGEGT